MKGDSARDIAIEKLVAGKLSARLQEEGRDCPDPETLAAYVERTLPEGERRAWETHLSACRRCQEQVAALVRMNEADELSYEALPPRAPRKVPWLRWAAVAPVLVALVVAALWYPGELRRLLRPPEQAAVSEPGPAEAPSDTSRTRAKDTGRALADRRELAEAEAPRQEAPKPTAELKSPARISVYGSPGSRVERRPGEAGGGVYGLSGEMDKAASITSAERGRKAEVVASTAVSDDLNRLANEGFRANARGLPSAEPAAPPAVAGGEVEARFAARDEELSKEVARSDIASKKAPSREDQRELAQRAAAPSESSVEFHGVIQDRRTWRVGRDGLIQKAAPNGNWEKSASGVKTDLFGISFATPAVGWAVGQAGTVLGTKDGGATWTKLPSPTTEDLVRVGAISETKVNVMARSGRTLQSSDGGRTWKTLGQD
jgi:hypothetical protein